MSKSNTTENDTLKAILKGVDPAWRSGANRYLSLHTADPGSPETGVQTTSECAYPGYARVAVPLADWTDGGSVFTNTNLLQFGICTAGSETARFLAIGTAASGAGQILYSGPLNIDVPIAPPIQPQFAPGAISVTED